MMEREEFLQKSEQEIGYSLSEEEKFKLWNMYQRSQLLLQLLSQTDPKLINHLNEELNRLGREYTNYKSN